MAGIASKFDKAYEALPVEELAQAPVAALEGVSESDAEHLASAFNIKTVADLGTNKYFLWAQAVAKLAE
ncbi:hypothetical protein ACH47B_11995 [Rhodococcus sp. NPDC019627]|uniref:hypothetical protein n=1 Tax=unclassified Rhodococcus (in: high G+C Gram-positive bacteria) TaxID=192944 RepID=UPI0033E95EAA